VSRGDPEVLVQRSGRIGRVTLNRPGSLNAVTPALAEGIADGLRELEPHVNVIVLRGAGGNFSVGGDIKFIEHARREAPDQVRELLVAFGRTCEILATLRVPVIAAVEGYAVAGGFELMQSCDFAIVRADARIGDHHVNLGLLPGGGSSQRLPRLVGRQQALALMLTGDHLSGSDAVAWGLAYRAVGGDDAVFERAVDELAERLADKSRETLVGIKALVVGGLEKPVPEGLADELSAALDQLASAGARERMEAFVHPRVGGPA
jgi:enoyl-CoA hydratase/carnithine racemase